MNTKDLKKVVMAGLHVYWINPEFPEAILTFTGETWTTYHLCDSAIEAQKLLSVILLGNDNIEG